jgi:hypothetical protein
MKWLGAVRVPNKADMTDEEIDASAEHFVDALLGNPR